MTEILLKNMSLKVEVPTDQKYLFEQDEKESKYYCKYSEFFRDLPFYIRVDYKVSKSGAKKYRVSAGKIILYLAMISYNLKELIA